MRILIAVGLGGIYSGGAHQALYLIAGLKAAGADVAAVWGPDVEGDPHGFDRLAALNVPLHLIPIHRKWTFDSLRAFRGVLTEWQPDVVECFKSGAQYHALYGGFGLRRHALLFYRGIGKPMEYFQALKYRLSRVDRIIANCEGLKPLMVVPGRIPEDKVEVVYDEHDPACANPDAIDAAGLRSELGIPENVLLFTQLGNWSPWRGQEFTLRAAAKLKSGGHRVHILFAGRESDKLLPVLQELGLNDIVTLSKYRRDPERILKITDVLVNASIANESLSGALTNASAMALPIVATVFTGSAEVVQEGENGFLVPPRDADQLAAAMRKFVVMPAGERRKMGAAGQERARKLFSSAVRARRHLECYERAIQHRRDALGRSFTQGLRLE